MNRHYLAAAMKEAQYEKTADGVYGEIATCKGVWAQAKTVSACKVELRQTLEDWLSVRISKGMSTPSFDSQRITPAAKVRRAQTKTMQVA